MYQLLYYWLNIEGDDLKSKKNILGNKEGWDLMSEEYQDSSDISVEDVHYSPLSFGEKSANLIGNVVGKKYVELGCGGGQNSIALAKLGADVTAVDLSSNQLTHAVSTCRNLGISINLLQANIQTLNYFPNNHFDGIISAFSLEFIEDIGTFFSESNRILKNRGQLILSTTHPLGAFEWDTESKNLLVTNYFNPPVEIWKEQGQISPGFTYFRTMEEIFSNVTENGFTIKKLLEPKPLDLDKELLSPYKGDYWTEFRDRLNAIPFAVVIQAVKD